MILRLTGTLLGLWLAVIPTFCHPMGNFSISRYARLTLAPQLVDLLYIIDIAEIPAFQEKPRLDVNGNGTLEDSEKEAYLSRKVAEFTNGLLLQVDGARYPLELTSQQLELLPGGLNLPTLKISLQYRLPLQRAILKDINDLDYHDLNLPGRTGWKEIVVRGDGIEESSVSAIDKSQQLTRYPEDPSIRPPDDLVAKVRFRRIEDGSSALHQTFSKSRLPKPWPVSVLLFLVLLALCGAGGFLGWRWFLRRKGA